jgi:hypothetical protein
VTPEESAPVASVDEADVVASVDEADVFGAPVDGGGDVFAYLDGLAREANERSRDAASGGPTRARYRKTAVLRRAPP